MQSKLLRIKLQPNSRQHLDKLMTYMQNNIEFAKAEMTQKGYFWDSVFFEESQGTEFLYIVIKSEDFSNIMMDESELDATPFRDVYEVFRKSCWAPEPYTDVEPIICFNKALDFAS